MIYIEVAEAEKNIEELLEKVISGREEVVFMENGQHIAKLIPCKEKSAETNEESLARP